MLNRQRVILHMLENAGRPVSRMELTKWSFILRHETTTGGGKAFYRFVPYHYGPFSFCLYQEAAGLVRKGLLREPDERTWELNAEVRSSTATLTSAIRNDIVGTVHQFGRRRLQDVTQYVYRCYPWFTVNSKRGRRHSRPVAPLAVYTAGYEGQSVDGFLNMVLRRGIQRIMDVRHNPVARRYGFHKNTLDRLCRLLDIQYVHVPELGIPPERRESVRTCADYDALFRRYEGEIAGIKTRAIARVVALMMAKPSVLMCMEADPNRCHRSRLAKIVANKANLPVRHLERCE